MNENKKINLIRFFDQRFGAPKPTHARHLISTP